MQKNILKESDMDYIYYDGKTQEKLDSSVRAFWEAEFPVDLQQPKTNFKYEGFMILNNKEKPIL